MANYVIGDVHGQCATLEKLLKKIRFHESRDRLWFVGDLIARGSDSIGVLQLVESLGDRAVVVMGNHEYSLLARSQYAKEPLKKEIVEIIEHSDFKRLFAWIKSLPMVHIDEEKGVIMAHAGIFPKWDLSTITTLNDEICAGLQGENWPEFLRLTFQDEPFVWDEEMPFIDKMRFAVNSFCRMRFLKKDGTLDLVCKTSPNEQKGQLLAWYELKQSQPYKIVFGHWAALGLTIEKTWACLDGGAGWGKSLIAFDLDTWQVKKAQSIAKK